MMAIDMGNGITAGEAIAVFGFIIAIIYQSTIVKANLQLVIDRVTKIELDLQKLTDVFIHQAELKSKYDGLNARIRTIEDRCFLIQSQKIVKAENHLVDEDQAELQRHLQRREQDD